jgi:hypothetical protein
LKKISEEDEERELSYSESSSEEYDDEDYIPNDSD